jgi:hypothetical protein
MAIRSKTRLLLFVLAVSLFSGGRALANGRFPRAQRLIESPTDANRLYLAATYGLLLTADRGRNWYHVCETAFSFQTNYAGDPIAGLTGNESLLVATDTSLNLSTDHGCDWKQTLSSTTTPKQSFVDFTVAPASAHPIVAVGTTYQQAGPVNQLWESTDGGATWKLIGTPLPVAVANTVDVDPADPTHIFATGLTAADDSLNTGVFLASTNHGATWSSHPIPNTSLWANPFIAAVHPTDSKKIFVRTDAWKDRSNIDTADDALLYSSDGGSTWTELLHPGGPDDASPGAKLFGFALSPDASTVLAGYGDPVDGSRFVDASWLGVYKSTTDGKYSFGADPASPTPAMLEAPISCLTWTKTGIYACITPQDESSFLVFAKDPTFTSTASMTRLMTLKETKGAPEACSGRAVASCNWSLDCAPLGACTDGGLAPTSGSGSTGTGGTGGAVGGTTGGATGGGGSGASATTGGGGAKPSTGGDDGSADKPKACGCRIGADHLERGPWMGWLMAVLVLRNRRQRTKVLRGPSTGPVYRKANGVTRLIA